MSLIFMTAWGKTKYKITFRFIETIFAAIILNSQLCLVSSILVDLNPNELRYYPFVVNLDRCDGSCNSLDDLSDRIYVSNKTEDLNAKVFNMITRTSRDH